MTTIIQQSTSTMSICLISLEEHYLSDNNSNIEILIDSRLPSNLDNILDKNTQLLFDQDNNNNRIFIARSLDKSAVLTLLGCIRNMGWYIGASTGYTQNDIIIRKFYFEKSFDLSKIVLVEPLKSKRNSRLAFHFDNSVTKPNSNSSSNSLSSSNSVPNNTSSDLAEFSRAIDKAQEAMSKSNSKDEFPRPTTLKPRRSSIAEGKPSIVFKQLAERRKVTINSSHPLDPKFENNSDENNLDEKKSSSNITTLAESRLFSRASSSPPPPLRNSVPFSNQPPPPPPPEAIKSVDLPKKGNVGGLASKFAGQLFFQPGAPPPIIKKHDIELTTGDGQLSTLTTSRPVTEKKRRPTAERRSMYVASMRAPLVPSASFDENDPLKLTKVHESDGRESFLNDNENEKDVEKNSNTLTTTKLSNISPQRTDRIHTDTNPLISPIKKDNSQENQEKSSPLPPNIPPRPPLEKDQNQKVTPPPPPPITSGNHPLPHTFAPPPPPLDNKVNVSNPPPPPPPNNVPKPPVPPINGNSSENKVLPPPPPPIQSSTASSSSSTTTTTTVNQPIEEKKVIPPPLPPTTAPSTTSIAPPPPKVIPPPIPSTPQPPIQPSTISPQPPIIPTSNDNNKTSHPLPPPPIQKTSPPPPPPSSILTSSSSSSTTPSRPSESISTSQERSRSRSPPPPLSQSLLQSSNENNVNTSPKPTNSIPPSIPSLASTNNQVSVETTEHEVTFSFEDSDKIDVEQDGRASLVDIDRLSTDSAKVKNAAYFKQMREEEERKKQEKLNELSPEERERLSLEEDAAKAHDQNKVNHFAKLGKSFAVSSSSKLLSGGRGRGAAGGRGSPTVKKALP